MPLENTVVVPYKGFFCAGQSYVALSKCKTKESFWLYTAVVEKDVIIDPMIDRFYSVFGG